MLQDVPEYNKKLTDLGCDDIPHIVGVVKVMIIC